MDERARRDHFITMLGSCWDSARLAGLHVQLRFMDGTQREGLPTVAATSMQGGEPTIEETGVRRELELDGMPVAVDALGSFTILWTS